MFVYDDLMGHLNYSLRISTNYNGFTDFFGFIEHIRHQTHSHHWTKK